MTQEQKITWIQYFQYLHSKWCEEFAKNLSLGQCIDKSLKDNVIITNFIDIFYNYQTIETPITNSFTINFLEDNTVESLNIYITLNDIVLGAIVTGTNSPFIDTLINVINTEYYPITGYKAYRENNSVIFYTFNEDAICELATLEVSKQDSTIINDFADLIQTCQNTQNILDSMNCITYKELCKLKDKLLILLKGCKCN